MVRYGMIMEQRAAENRRLKNEKECEGFCLKLLYLKMKQPFFTQTDQQLICEMNSSPVYLGQFCFLIALSEGTPRE
jgi:hypothetical protein